MNILSRAYPDAAIWLKSLASLFLRRECVCCSSPLRAFETDICTACLADLPSSYTWIESDSPADKAFWGRVETEKVTSLSTVCPPKPTDSPDTPRMIMALSFPAARRFFVDCFFFRNR